MNPEVFVGGCVVPHPFKPWEGHAACADCHGARGAVLGDKRPLHPLPKVREGLSADQVAELLNRPWPVCDNRLADGVDR